jgi:hypothetical protein
MSSSAPNDERAEVHTAISRVHNLITLPSAVGV